MQVYNTNSNAYEAKNFGASYSARNFGNAYSSAETKEDLPNGYNNYLMTQLDPFGAPTTNIPDQQLEWRVDKRENRSQTLTGYKNYLLLFTPHSRVTKLVAFKRATVETPWFGVGDWVPFRIVPADDPIEENFSYDRVVSAGLEVFSNTISTTNFELSGQIFACSFQELFDFTKKSGIQITSFSKDETSRIIGHEVFDGVICTADPLTQDFLPTNNLNIQSNGPAYVVNWNSQLDQKLPDPDTSSGVSYDWRLFPGIHFPFGLIGKTEVKMNFAANLPLPIEVNGFIGLTVSLHYAVRGGEIETKQNNKVVEKSQGMTRYPEISVDFTSDSQYMLVGVSIQYMCDGFPVPNQLQYSGALKNADSLAVGANQPGIMVVVENVDEKQVLQVNAAINYEAIPNNVLIRNFKTGGVVNDNIADLDHCMSVLSRRPYFGLRSVYKRSQYISMAEKGTFRNLALNPAHGYRASFLGDILNLGKDVIKTGIIGTVKRYTSSNYRASFQSCEEFHRFLSDTRPIIVPVKSRVKELQKIKDSTPGAHWESSEKPRFRLWRASGREEAFKKRLKELLGEFGDIGDKELRSFVYSSYPEDRVFSRRTAMEASDLHKKATAEMRAKTLAQLKGEEIQTPLYYKVPVVASGKVSYLRVALSTTKIERFSYIPHQFEFKSDDEKRHCNLTINIDEFIEDQTQVSKYFDYLARKNTFPALPSGEYYLSIVEMPADMDINEKIHETSWMGAFHLAMNKVMTTAMVTGVFQDNGFKIPGEIPDKHLMAQAEGLFLWVVSDTRDDPLALDRLHEVMGISFSGSYVQAERELWRRNLALGCSDLLHIANLLNCMGGQVVKEVERHDDGTYMIDNSALMKPQSGHTEFDELVKKIRENPDFVHFPALLRKALVDRIERAREVLLGRPKLGLAARETFDKQFVNTVNNIRHAYEVQLPQLKNTLDRAKNKKPVPEAKQRKEAEVHVPNLKKQEKLRRQRQAEIAEFVLANQKDVDRFLSKEELATDTPAVLRQKLIARRAGGDYPPVKQAKKKKKPEKKEPETDDWSEDEEEPAALSSSSADRSRQQKSSMTTLADF